MRQVALPDFETYFEESLYTLSNVTTVGALNAGSITSVLVQSIMVVVQLQQLVILVLGHLGDSIIKGYS